MIHTYIHTYVCTYIHTNTHAHTHIIHTYTHTHIRIYLKKMKNLKYIYKCTGISGNGQRNYALTRITNEHKLLYYLDDDNIIHPDLYNL